MKIKAPGGYELDPDHSVDCLFEVAIGDGRRETVRLTINTYRIVRTLLDRAMKRDKRDSGAIAGGVVLIREASADPSTLDSQPLTATSP